MYVDLYSLAGASSDAKDEILLHAVMLGQFRRTLCHRFVLSVCNTTNLSSNPQHSFLVMSSIFSGKGRSLLTATVFTGLSIYAGEYTSLACLFCTSNDSLLYS